MNNSILIFTTRHLCYYSADFFALRLAQELGKMGYICELCELPENGIPGEQHREARLAADYNGAAVEQQTEQILEQFIDREYMAVIDFNSKLPRLVLDDGSYYLDHINAPFYNYILDNPLYHHSTLSCRISNYNVLLVDGNHCEYVREYYPHIKSVDRVMLGADISEESLGCEKDKYLLFMGTYRNPSDYLVQINHMAQKIKNGNACFADLNHEENMKNMISIMTRDTGCTMEQALKGVLRAEGVDISKSEFALLMNYYYPVEMYLRNLYRDRLIKVFSESALPVKAAGDGWEKCECAVSSNLKIERPVKFDKSYEMIAHNQILLDSSPFFKNGAHDRIFAGMANFSVVLTDNNPYIEENFAKKSLLMTYSLENLNSKEGADMIRSRAEEMLNNTELCREMADRAYEEYMKKYTWRCTAENILSIIGTKNC
jgi:hypothetical protein